MKQEYKDLLLKDLCGRLPYEAKVEVTYSKYSGSSLRARLCSEGVNILDTNILGLFQQSEVYIKPYLFPLSSMTEEQKKEWRSLMIHDSYGILYPTIKSFDYLYKNHIDIRGLIPMGLAIDSTELKIY